MKIRTITTGTDLDSSLDKVKLKQLALFMKTMKGVCEESGLEVQSIRAATQPWPRYLGSVKNDIIGRIQEIEDIIYDLGIDFLSIGTVKRPEYVDLIPKIIVSSTKISASVTVDRMEIAQQVAKAMKDIAHGTERGNGNFRFAAIANCPSDIPFFPAGYHEGKTCFAIGLECSDLVSQAFDGAKGLADAESRLAEILQRNLAMVEELGVKAEEEHQIFFKGVDPSPAPSLAKDKSIAFAFEKLVEGKFGEPGTKTIAEMVTRVLKSLKIRRCGYSGLMLPVLEDYGLAQRWGEGMLDIYKILSYSAVCGTGLDCIPLPIDAPLEKIASVIMDVVNMANRLNKPLSARLLPVPGKRVGEMTDFKSPYLVDCKITDPW